MKTHFWAFIGFCLTTTAGFVGCIIWQTVTPAEAPILFSEGVAYAWNDPHNDMVIMYHREVVALRTTTAEVHREIICHREHHDEAFDLPLLTREYVKGEEKAIKRFITFPVSQPLGTKCALKTAIRWWPVFSMTAHIVPMPDIEFEVQSGPQEIT